MRGSHYSGSPRAEAGAFSPVRSQSSDNSGPAVLEAWVLLGVLAEGPLQTARGCCCCPSGCGGGWRGAGARVWSPRCSPPGPRPAPEPPDGPARRPPAGGGYAPSPGRGSRRLGTGAGSEPGNRAPPSEEGPPPPGQAGHWLCVSPKLSLHFSTLCSNPEQLPSEDGVGHKLLHSASSSEGPSFSISKLPS